MVIISIKMKAIPAKHKELIQTLSSITKQVQNEYGFKSACIYQSVEDENELLLMEKWSNQEASDTHLGSDLFLVLKGAGSLMTRQPKIVIHTVDQSTVIAG